VAVTAGYLIPINESWSLQVRGKYGKVFADDTDALPTDLRFFAGGDRSVRGYSYQELSPVDASGTSIGGSEMLVASIEPTYYFANNWAAVAFYDVGSAYDSAPSTLPYGYGLGIRWRSPVGQIGFDLAQAEHPDYSDIRVHFRLGVAL
jgi:translocation and assembly module TamA